MAVQPDMRERLVEALIARCTEEIDGRYPVGAEHDPCRDLGVCEEDLDDVQIDAASSVGLRLPYPGEELAIPWSGPNLRLSINDLAEWIAANGRAL